MTSKRSLKNKRILITCGPTWIPIDQVRVLSNISTGELGQLLARDCTKEGARVTLLEGRVTHGLSIKNIKVVSFTFYQELFDLLKKELKKKYDVVIHAAAVSDYTLKKPFAKKLSSGKSKLALDLIPTKKIIHVIKRQCPKVFLVGFKLEPKTSPKKAFAQSQVLFQKARCDLVVVNSLLGKGYRGMLINKEGRILFEQKTKGRLIKGLIKALKDYS